MQGSFRDNSATLPPPISVTYLITGLSTGGTEYMLLKLLQHLDRSRFSPRVISLSTKGEIGPRIEALGVPVQALGMRSGMPNLARFARLVRLLLASRPVMVHTWMYHADLLGGLSARLTGCKNVIWCVRSSNLSKTENKRSTLMVVKACAVLSGWIPSEILSCSHRAKEVHTAAGYLEDKIHIIPNGFDLVRFAPAATAGPSVRAELGLPLDTPLVGLMARHDPHKNHLGFFEAAARLRAHLPQVHFVLAGTGIDARNASLTAAIARQGLQTNTHLLGRRDDMPRLMAALDVLASSSHGEAFPNVLGEAMACGVPCVVTDVGDCAEIVGPTGRVVPAGDMSGLADQLLAVLRLPPADKAALGQQARARVAAEYEIGHVTRLYQAFYEQVVQNQRHVLS